MQNQAAQAYQQVAKQTANPRDVEANLLTKSAQNMQALKDNWPDSRPDLFNVLNHNRKLWTVFLNTVTKEDNPLPDAIKQNVANLGLFVMNHTMELQAAPAPEKLDVLMNINRELAAGLRGKA